MSKVVVIGGGAAGMFASIAAAGCGHQVVVYEKNEKLGKKLYITGKGRCNITNACDMEGLFDAVRTNAKFLYSSFYGYTNQQVIDFFERIGVPTKIERGLFRVEADGGHAVHELHGVGSFFERDPRAGAGDGPPGCESTSADSCEKGCRKRRTF